METRQAERPKYDINSKSFEGLLVQDAMLHHLADGCLWAEGAVFLHDRDVVLWSDVRNDRRLCLDIPTGSVTVADQPANFCNGHTTDNDGLLIACEHGTRSVSRFESDGSRTVLADRFEGKRLNSPNDVVVASDGSTWFTDPTYGIDSDNEGYRAESEIGSSNVYRIDPDTGEVTSQIDDMVRPNGLAFSPDECSLYVSDTGVSHVDDGPRHIRRFDIDTKSFTVTGGGEVFAVCPEGVFDGFRFDTEGRMWASGAKGVHCYESDGTLIGTVHLPEACANVVFGGPGRSTLYMAASTSLYSLEVAATGL